MALIQLELETTTQWRCCLLVVIVILFIYMSQKCTRVIHMTCSQDSSESSCAFAHFNIRLICCFFTIGFHVLLHLCTFVFEYRNVDL